jgi:hypothetical protein
MAIAPLQVPQLGAVSALDFSGLEKLGEQIKQGRLDQQRREAVQAYAGGDPRALLTGDLKLAELYLQDQLRKQAQANSDRTFNAGREDAAQAQANADRAHGLALRTANRADNPIPEGFQRSPEGGLVPISGGPRDPAYIASASAAKPRQMSVTDITKLSEEGGKFADLTRFGETFKDDYAGRPIIGEARNWVGRNLPSSMVDPAAAESASWWQGYDRFKNVVRNELFGSALTAPERAAFEKADIGPGMSPEIIRKNLAIQKQVVENAMRRKADAMTSAGYSPDVVSKAYGVQLDGSAPKQAPQGAGGVVDWQTYFGGAK